MRTIFLLTLLAALGLAAGCGGMSTSSTTTTTTTTPTGSSSTGSNVLAITVNGGPAGNYQNGAFASATVCAPGSTSNCVTIDNLLVDTGSTGLRVFDSEVSALGLPAASASNGSAAFDCVSFVDGSFLWGPVDQADVTLGSETASSVPIQVISSSATGVPSSCSNGSSENENTAALLGANGILGVGTEPTDCYLDGTSPCAPSSGLGTPPSPAYYTCSGSSSSTCTPAFVAKANQVTNPVVLFPTDNNGVIVELPSATSSEASLSGSLIFGIGTESNNALPSGASIFTMSCGFFTTVFDGQTFGVTNAATCAGAGSFIDSGSNGLFFQNVSNIPVCPSNSGLSSFYCPATTDSLSATMEGANGTSKSVSFSVANAENIFSSATTAADPVQPQVDGVEFAGSGFDWGLPFFYGVNVYNAIDGQSVPSGAPAAPWWAY